MDKLPTADGSQMELVVLTKIYPLEGDITERTGSRELMGYVHKGMYPPMVDDNLVVVTGFHEGGGIMTSRILSVQELYKEEGYLVVTERSIYVISQMFPPEGEEETDENP